MVQVIGDMCTARPHARCLVRIPAGSARKDVATAPFRSLPAPISQTESPARLLRACTGERDRVMRSTLAGQAARGGRSDLRQCLHDVCRVHDDLGRSAGHRARQHLALKAQRRRGRLCGHRTPCVRRRHCPAPGGRWNDEYGRHQSPPVHFTTGKKI